MKNQNKGITLIALIITIIVLLILAAVLINMIFGQNGIVSNAENAVGVYKVQQEKEKIMLCQVQAAMAGNGVIDVDAFKQALVDNGVVNSLSDITANGNNLEVTTKSGNKFYLTAEVNSKDKVTGFEVAVITTNVPTQEEQQLVETDLSYFKFNNAGDTIIGVVNKNTLPSEIVIPSKNGDVTVNRIGIDVNSAAFKNCTNLTKVIIPNSITSIGEYAFSGCTNLTKINIPNSVTTVGASVFYNCNKLKKAGAGEDYNINYEQGFKVMFINNNANYLTKVVIPSGVTSIATNALYSER